VGSIVHDQGIQGLTWSVGNQAHIVQGNSRGRIQHGGTHIQITEITGGTTYHEQPHFGQRFHHDPYHITSGIVRQLHLILFEIIRH
jgi:hypothetical protein